MTAPTVPSASSAPCTQCGQQMPATARFCEACGSPSTLPDIGDAPASGHLSDPVSDPAPDPVSGDVTARDSHPLDLGSAPISAPTRRNAAALADPPRPQLRRPCASCGAEVGPDGYCLECGTKARSERDHFQEVPASWVAGVCDKGVTKNRNEDAMALLAGTESGSRAVLIVLDGVSNSVDSDKASLAGARAARDVLRLPLPGGLGTDESRAAAAVRVFENAVRAANTAIIAVTDPDSPNPASATFTAAVLEAGTVTFAGLGDSRAYWLPDGGAARQLTVDDSLAQEQIAAGIPREVAESSPQAHAITKWLGRDSEDPTPRVGRIEVTEPGWLLVCSDGLWNYASSAADLGAWVAAAAGPDVAAMAEHLVDKANQAGGHDNITVALARVGPMPTASLSSPSARTDDTPDASEPADPMALSEGDTDG